MGRKSNGEAQRTKQKDTHHGDYRADGIWRGEGHQRIVHTATISMTVWAEYYHSTMSMNRLDGNKRAIIATDWGRIKAMKRTYLHIRMEKAIRL